MPVSEAARAAPPPRLGETAEFDAALARADPDARRLETDAADLAARATALRARAAAMGAPISTRGPPRGSRPARAREPTVAVRIDPQSRCTRQRRQGEETIMNSIIYIVGLIVVVLAVLSLVGLA